MNDESLTNCQKCQLHETRLTVVEKDVSEFHTKLNDGLATLKELGFVPVCMRVGLGVLHRWRD